MEERVQVGEIYLEYTKGDFQNKNKNRLWVLC